MEASMRVLSAPSNIDEAVLRFCSGISPERPLYVRVEPAADAKPTSCFDNVARQIKRHKGGIAYGWAIWHWPGRYFEAEHHGVWLSPDGALLDISPQLDGRERVLFLPHPRAIYDPLAFRSNILEAEGSDPVAVEFVEAARAFGAILDRYRGPGVTQPVFTAADKCRLALLGMQIEGLVLRMNS
jgi:hypothetical protein